MEKLKAFFEQRAFGVCTWLGDVTGVSSGSIRLFFIYASFITIGSPIIFYLAIAFLLNMHKHFRRRESTVWDV
jgi:phage shock protein PspC (stress-responsive transcriptional regulator)